MPLPTPRSLFRSSPKTVYRSGPHAPRIQRRRPKLESLEDRVVPSVLFVDDDHAQRPNAPYTTISAAVAAAQPGDTIKVEAGTYHESVNVDKTLNIVADRKGGAAIVDPGTMGSGFNVQANDVTIRGFTVQDAVGSAGITLNRSFSGADIENNLLRNNTFGIYLNSNGADRTTILNNVFRDNNAAGSASGNGIYSDQGVSNALIQGNSFTGDANAAMIFLGNGSVAQAQSNLRIRGNTLTDDAPIIMVNVSDSVISGNVDLRSSGSGIFFGGGVHNVEVSHNVLRDGAFTGINLRTDPADYPVAAGAVNTDNRIVDNVISGFGDSGIRLREGASGNLVAHNRITGNGTANDPTTGDGISLEAAVNNVVRDNQVLDNRRDGIRVDASSSGNLILNNRLRDNGEFDARDDSTGSGTAGTANTWRGNSGATENRPGLLSRHEHPSHHHDSDHDHDFNHDHHRSHEDHDHDEGDDDHEHDD